MILEWSGVEWKVERLSAARRFHLKCVQVHVRCESKSKGGRGSTHASWRAGVNKLSSAAVVCRAVVGQAASLVGGNCFEGEVCCECCGADADAGTPAGAAGGGAEGAR